MIIQADVVGLEVLVTAYNSQDKVLYKELRDKLDIHTDNQEKFGLPNRDIAKIFVFKLLYGATAPGFANDPDFTFISSNPRYWQKIIDKYYEKYKGVASWHTWLLQEAAKTGVLVSPSGREYEFEMYRNYKGELKLPATKIKNYLTQGFGADIMSVARISFFKRIEKSGMDCLHINTVHDSIVIDSHDRDVDGVVKLFVECFRDLPRNIARVYNIPFDLEVRCEIMVGKNQLELEPVIKT